jgi:chemotaxis protein methyltransferase CheR
MIEFREMNLTEAWSFLPKMDVVFMRNVLIYFNHEAKRKILSKIAPLLPSSGYLFLGSAETTLNIAEEFEPLPGVSAACYRLKRPKLL